MKTRIYAASAVKGLKQNSLNVSYLLRLQVGLLHHPRHFMLASQQTRDNHLMPLMMFQMLRHRRRRWANIETALGECHGLLG